MVFHNLYLTVWDDISETCLETAVREMFEEGFGNREVNYQLFSPYPIDLDIHPVFDHIHYDLCYACAVEDESLFECSDESEEVQWIPIGEVVENTQKYRPRIGTMIEKVLRNFKKRYI